MSARANKAIAILGCMVLIFCMGGAFFFGRSTMREDVNHIRIERDTIIVRDTIREYFPQEVKKDVVRTERVEVPVIVRDTIHDTVYVNVPIEEREYKSRDYRVVIGGFNPYLKSVEVYPQTVYLTTTETITKQKRWNVSFGAQMGYGFTPKGWQPYTGLGITFGVNF